MAEVTTVTPVRGGVWYKYEETDAFGRLTTSVSSETSRTIGTGVATVKRNSNPDWKTKVAKGVDASSHYYTCGWEIYKIPLASARGTYDFGTTHNTIKAYRYGFWGIPGSYGTDIQDPTTADIALAKLKSRLREQVGNFKLLAPTGELRELRTLVRDAQGITFKTLAEFVQLRREGGWTSLGATSEKFARRAAKLWLTLSFALRPLVGDIDRLLESIEKYLTNIDKTVRVSATHQKVWTASTKSQMQNTPMGWDGYEYVYAKHTISYKYISAFDLMIDYANNYGWRSHFGVQLQDVPSAAWELTAFSWMFDYFSTVGAFLEDVFESPPGTTKFVVQNRRYTIDIDTRTQFLPGNFGKITQSHVGLGKLRMYQFERTPLTSLPHRALRWKTVDEIGINANTKLLNLISVLTPSLSFNRRPTN